MAPRPPTSVPWPELTKLGTLPAPSPWIPMDPYGTPAMFAHVDEILGNQPGHPGWFALDSRVAGAPPVAGKKTPQPQWDDLWELKRTEAFGSRPAVPVDSFIESTGKDSGTGEMVDRNRAQTRARWNHSTHGRTSTAADIADVDLAIARGDAREQKIGRTPARIDWLRDNQSNQTTRSLTESMARRGWSPRNPALWSLSYSTQENLLPDGRILVSSHQRPQPVLTNAHHRVAAWKHLVDNHGRNPWVPIAPTSNKFQALHDDYDARFHVGKAQQPPPPPPPRTPPPNGAPLFIQHGGREIPQPAFTQGPRVQRPRVKPKGRAGAVAAIATLLTGR